MTNTGFMAMASRIGYQGTGITATNIAIFNAIGIGTGTTNAAATDTQLQTSVAINQSGVTLSLVQTTVANDTLQAVHVFSAANDSGCSGASSITEVGFFNGVTNGTSIMCLHQVFSPADYCNWANGDTESITIQLKCEQGS
jgi:hypothetical protein